MSVATEAIYDVFVCHGTLDVGIADVVRRAFEAEQLEVFAVHEIIPDDSFMAEVRRALAECHAFVLLLTRSTLQSPDVALEIGMATAWNKPVYVLYDGIAKSEIPVYLNEFHVAPISHLDRIVKEIRGNQQPLTQEQLERLLKVYEEFGIPTDKLLTKPVALRELAHKYNRNGRTSIPAEKLIQELIRLRKQGKVPKLRRQ